MDFEYLKWFLLREREREWWVFLLSQDWFKGAHSLKFWKAGWYVWFYFCFVLGSFFWNFLLHSFLGFWSILLFSWNFFCRFINFFLSVCRCEFLWGFKIVSCFLKFWVIFSWKFTSGFQNSRMDIELVLCLFVCHFMTFQIST